IARIPQGRWLARGRAPAARAARVRERPSGRRIPEVPTVPRGRRAPTGACHEPEVLSRDRQCLSPRRAADALLERSAAERLVKSRVAAPRAVNIADLRRMAKRRLPKAVFDYIDGGADAEITLRENSRA